MTCSPLFRRARWWAALLACVAVGFVLGVRSAENRDLARQLVVDGGIKLRQEFNRFQGRFRGEKRDLLETDDVETVGLPGLSLTLRHLPRLGSTLKTAGFVPDAQGRLTRVEQDELHEFWSHHELEKVIPDAVPTQRHGGGIKQIFVHINQALALVNLHTRQGCHTVSLVNLTLRRELFRAPCLPPGDDLDFDRIGGGWTATRGGLLVALGTPSDQPAVAALAQDPASPYGKVLYFRNVRIVSPERFERGDFELHSSGLHNPLGLSTVNGLVYGVDARPDGDRVNLMAPARDQGWPQPGPATLAPLQRFLSAAEPSDITGCPGAWAQRFAPLDCVLVSSLRGRSLFVGLVDRQALRMVSFERLPLDMPLREFVPLPEGRLAVSTDGYGVFEIVPQAPDPAPADPLRPAASR